MAFEHAGQREDVADVVVDDQDLGSSQLGNGAPRSLDRASAISCASDGFCFWASSTSWSEDADEIGALGGLFGDARGPQAHRRAAAIRAGNDVDRDVPGLGIVLEEVEQDEAVDIGETKIERDRRRLKLASHGQGAGSGRRDDALDARLVGCIEQDRREGRVVLDDQHERVLAELVAVVADLEPGRQRGRHDRAAIVVACRRPNYGPRSSLRPQAERRG